jgi:hypothetical protein
VRLDLKRQQRQFLPSHGTIFCFQIFCFQNQSNTPRTEQHTTGWLVAVPKTRKPVLSHGMRVSPDALSQAVFPHCSMSEQLTGVIQLMAKANANLERMAVGGEAVQRCGEILVPCRQMDDSLLPFRLLECCKKEFKFTKRGWREFTLDSLSTLEAK